MTKIFYYLIKLFDKQTEEKVQNKICELLGSKIGLLVDVGFFLGEYFKNLKKKIEIQKAIAFEPNPETFKKVKKIFLTDNTVEIINCALGEKNSTKDFNLNFEPSSSSFNEMDFNSKYFKKKNIILNLFGFQKINKSIPVQIKTLDEILQQYDFKNIDLIKIDTEGYEYKIIKGIKNIIKNVKVIHFEHHYDNMLVKNYNISDIHDYLVSKILKNILK